MINKGQLRELVSDVLSRLDMHSESAENLILGTIAQESRGGYYIKQLGRGPALGMCQMEPATMRDIYTNYLSYKSKLTDTLVAEFGIVGPDEKRLHGDLIYQIVLCRIHYLRVKEALPEPDDLKGLAWYWKANYNTVLGAGTTDEFVENYQKYVI